MGRLASLVEIAQDLFAQVAAGAEPDPDVTGTSHSLDKAWEGFHAVLGSKGPPLSLAIAGDCRHPLSPYSLDEYCEGSHDYYLGLVSPRLVREVADELANVGASDYKRWQTEAIQAGLAGEQYNGGEFFFPDLRAAYLEAAARKNGLMVVIA